MTSSVHDSNGAEEPQKQSEAETDYQSSANGIFQHGVPHSSEHMMPPHFEVGHAVSQAVYTYQDPYYRSIFAPYCPQPQPMIHTHVMGIQPAVVPLPSDTVEEPVYVNAKQYHGILRRRQIRAKAESENKLIKSRKPYLHESRHLHAVRRARALSGRFLNSKTDEKQQNEVEPHDKAQPSDNSKSDENRGSSSDRAS